MTQVLCVAGARPNFMKIAPIMAAFHDTGIAAQLLHTGQHYDAAMSDSFFADLGIPRPDHHLEVGSGSHAVQTAEVMKRFEPVLDSVQPHAVLVVGDVNSTIACALVAAKRGVRDAGGNQPRADRPDFRSAVHHREKRTRQPAA
jgi:UDP-N-acetylglucosamine 2-epimerase (non-hydrolysing)